MEGNKLQRMKGGNEGREEEMGRGRKKERERGEEGGEGEKEGRKIGWLER